MRCFHQVKMTPAPLMTKGIRANSPSMEEDEDLDVDGSKGDLNDDDLDIGEPPI